MLVIFYVLHKTIKGCSVSKVTVSSKEYSCILLMIFEAEYTSVFHNVIFFWNERFGDFDFLNKREHFLVRTLKEASTVTSKRAQQVKHTSAFRLVANSFSTWCFRTTLGSSVSARRVSSEGFVSRGFTSYKNDISLMERNIPYA